MKETRQDLIKQAELVALGGSYGASRWSGWARAQGWFVLPPAAWSRIVVLFGALAVIKLVLLIWLRTHLQQVHWRISGQPKTWLNYVAFCVVLVTGVFTLIELSRHCQRAGVRAVRHVNAMILGLGLLLILLTFHEGDKNYLYPILTGVLKWTSLVPCLSMDLFFRPPFLAAWLFGYTMGYYVLARLRHEKNALIFTCVFAACYWIVSLPEFLERGEDLWVAAMFGLLALILLRRPDRRIHPAWWLVPLGWTLLIWGLFWLGVRDLAHLSTYFVLLLSATVVLFTVATWLATRARVFQPWIKVLGFYGLAFLLFSNFNYPMAENYNNLIGFSAKFPHYFLGELCVASFAAVVAVLYSRFRPRGSFWWLDVLGLGLIILALVDLRLAQIMGVRLGWDVIQFGNSPAVMWRMAKPFVPGLTVGAAVAFLAYAAAVRGVNWLLRCRSTRRDHKHSGAGGWCLAGCFALFAVLGMAISKPDNVGGQSVLRLIKSSPLGRWAGGQIMGTEEFRRTATELGMAGLISNRVIQDVPRRTNLNVLLIFQESAYNKYCSLFSGTEETQPLLANYKDRMEIFPNFFSSFQGSIHARFATFTGLYPICDFNAFTLNRVAVKSIFEILHENGYVCSMFYSSFFDYTGFRSFLENRGLDEMYDADTMPGERKTERVSWGLREEETLRAIRMQIRRQAMLPKPFFLTYIPAAPHYPYDNIPEAFRKYKPGLLGDYTPFYLNELLYTDWIITSILDELKETGLLDRTLVVVTSDHGEMLGSENGPVGHGWKLTPELANVPLILMDPSRQEYRVNHTIGSQVDLLPTLLDSLGIPLPPGELYQGCSLRSSPANGQEERYVYLSSYQDYAVINGNHFWKGDRRGELGRDDDRSVTAYQISNNGQRTLFTMTSNVLNPAISIHRFDRFQESLLRNYSFYRNSLRNGVPTKSSPASE